MQKVAYCGRIGSFSHEASSVMFPNAEYLGLDTFALAIEHVEKDLADFAVIPIENSTAGRIAEIHNILPKMELFFHKEYILRISHNLYVSTANTKLQDITEIHSHTQALMQCSEFLSKLNATEIQELNTAIAAEKLGKSQSPDIGVICSGAAGKHYGLHLLAQNIQNNDHNYTTFVAVCKKQNVHIEQNPLTSILFTIANKSGGIYEALGCFANNKINLLKIESYIPGGFTSPHAQFFLTFEGNHQDRKPKQALKDLSKIAVTIKNFGSYQGDTRRFSTIE